MAFSAIETKIPKQNDFYRQYYPHVLIALMILIALTIIAVGVVMYQVLNRPLPVFYAQQAPNQRMLLTPSTEPNLLPDTILRWASKAAIAAYTFDFTHYDVQLSAAHVYFTDAGWLDYKNSVSTAVKTIVQNQLIVTSVVAGTPVISNEGDLPRKGYTWRVQIPFLVTYQSGNSINQVRYFVILTIVRVPTQLNPQGIGIDQFVMVNR